MYRLQPAGLSKSLTIHKYPTDVLVPWWKREQLYDMYPRDGSVDVTQVREEGGLRARAISLGVCGATHQAGLLASSVCISMFSVMPLVVSLQSE